MKSEKAQSAINTLARAANDCTAYDVDEGIGDTARRMLAARLRTSFFAAAEALEAIGEKVPKYEVFK